ncbi:MAG: hypothetical protein ACPGU0_02655 [Marinirhabdus sp.]
MKTDTAIKKQAMRHKESPLFFSSVWCGGYTDVWIGSPNELNTGGAIKLQNLFNPEFFEETNYLLQIHIFYVLG